MRHTIRFCGSNAATVTGTADPAHQFARRTSRLVNLTPVMWRRMFRGTPKTPTGVAGDPRRELARTGANSEKPHGVLG